MHERDMKLIAHGGYSAAFPENTTQSFKEAVVFNPQVIEMDVIEHPTTGELICFHPHGVSSQSGTFSKETILEQINSGEEFPKVSEVISQIPEPIRVLLDFKQPSKEVFNKAFSCLDVKRVIWGIRNVDDFRFVRSLSDNIETLALFSDPDDFIEYAKLGGKYFRIWEKDVTEARVQAIHQAGLEVWVTPGDKATATTKRTAGEVSQEKLEYFASLLVDAVLVNDIALARKSIPLK